MGENNSGSEVPANQTIYINNLNEKIKLDELKKTLHAMFSQFGKVLDVLAFKTLKHKGQAWVVFEDVSSATNAIRQMQSFPFYDKPMYKSVLVVKRAYVRVMLSDEASHVFCIDFSVMRTKIQYAKTKSDIIAKADGTFVPRERRKRHEEKGRKRKEQQDANQAGMGLNPAYPGAYGGAPPLSQIPYPGGVKSMVPEAPAPPNNILFVQNLPHEATSAMLQMLFCQYPGFKEVRMVEAKPGIAFVEYENEMQSTMAMQNLQAFKVTPQNSMLITYAKK
ncbi:hypothetical protein ACLB2K_010432 [Fragaria x ananassa]